MFTVPLIDLETAPASALTDALRTASCAFIVNHGIDPALRAEMLQASTDFFELPRELKAPTQWPGDGIWRGWQPVYEGAPELTGSRAPEPMERFEIQLAGHRGHDPQSVRALQDSFEFWPTEPAEFTDVWTRYYLAMGDLASRLTRDIVDTLDLNDDALPAWTDEHFANLVAIDYHAQETPESANELRARSHTDRGGFTLLWADDAPGGLEVMLPATRTWVPVQIPPNAFIVQAGDLLGRWTNKLIRPNIHRVVNPPPEAFPARRRIAIVYFHYPRLDSIVAPAPSCLTGERAPARPIVAGDLLLRRQNDYKGTDDLGVQEILDDFATI
jgi:isopenicillin N synthase-like dioxygenase